MVQNHVGTWYPNVGLSLEKNTKKLVILLAICTAHRVQTLCLIKLENIQFSPSSIKIYITDIIKTFAPGREQPTLSLPCFNEIKSICPATVLADYISRVRYLRPGENKGIILLTHRKPHKPATTASISRLIKQTLSDSGVDISIFKANSMRHASTSVASADRNESQNRWVDNFIELI